MRRPILTLAAFLVFSAIVAYAGGPAFVAGAGYNTGVEGQPLIWANGSVEYFTDQGNLSPILTGAQADAFVAAAFSTWTSISGVALTATQGGHLAEDVNGSNIETNGEGVVTAPADITPSAVSTPVGIVYDYDGTVTDAILGQGAGNSADCFTNAVYGGPDNFAATGNLVHSLVVINGVCATTSSQLPDVQYRLVRVLGRTLGLGWSQANLNVITRTPPPTNADYAGFPVMHFKDIISCVPITVCYPNPSVPNMDDMDALAWLYPASGNPQPSGRVYGSVYFTNASGSALQQMQGVNVVARLMVNNQPSRQYVRTSVSGFRFCGNAGNIIDGYLDGTGLPYDRWGSDDPMLEGFYDLGQLMIPTGQTIAEYQLSMEALDPQWSMDVGPYAPTQVTPSGTFAPVVVTVTNGSNAERDILMLQDEVAQPGPGSASTYANPSPLPVGGEWGSWISGYGTVDYFQFTAQANRTTSVAVMALDEAGQPTESKLLPVIGIWELSDQSQDPAPASTPSAFNTATFGLSRLDAQFGVSEAFRIAVADFRGDGRPDYFYQASVLYSDTVTPARLSVAGGVTTLNGIGFNPRQQVTVAGNSVSSLSVSASQVVAFMPGASQDGTATIQVTDPVTGAFSQMIDALTYGASSTDLLLLLQGAEPSTPVGSQAANPVRVRAVAADGVTPVSGATIAWNSTNGLQFSTCGGSSSCSVLSDAAGESFSWVTPTATGLSTITIALAPAVYSPPQSQLATVVGTSTTLDLAAITPTHWIGQGATISLPLTVEALDLGVPKPNVTVNFTLTQGTASLSGTSATTNGSGLAAIIASVSNLSVDVKVSACVAPNNSPCQTFVFFATPASLWTLETVSGASQFVQTGQSFQPLVMRVTDGSLAANPVMGVPVTFNTTLGRVSTVQNGPSGGETLTGGDAVPVLLAASQALVVTDQNGLASIVPSAQNLGPCDVFIVVSAGAAAAQFQMESAAAIVLQQSQHTPAKTPLAVSQPHSDAAAQTNAPQPLPISLFALPEAAPLDSPTDQNSAPNPQPEAPSSKKSAAVCPPADGNGASCELPDEMPRVEEAPRPQAVPSTNPPAKSPVDSKQPDQVPNPDKDATPQPLRDSSANRSSVSDLPTANPPVSNELEDKRTCRFSQNENGVFFATAPDPP